MSNDMTLRVNGVEYPLSVEPHRTLLTVLRGELGLTGTKEGCDDSECGFCTPGMLISAAALLRGEPHPTADQVRLALGGNLCRCTGYQKITSAVLRAAEEMAKA